MSIIVTFTTAVAGLWRGGSSVANPVSRQGPKACYPANVFGPLRRGNSKRIHGNLVNRANPSTPQTPHTLNRKRVQENIHLCWSPPVTSKDCQSFLKLLVLKKGLLNNKQCKGCEDAHEDIRTCSCGQRLTLKAPKTPKPSRQSPETNPANPEPNCRPYLQP